MSDFSTEATIEFRVDKSSLRDVRETVDDELGATEVGVTDGGTASAQSGRLSSRQRRQQRQTVRLDRERNELLERMVTFLEEIEEGGGGFGGGGGGSGGGFLGLGGLGGAGSLLGGSGLALGGALLGGAGLGVAGTRALQEAGVTDAARGLGQDAGELPGTDLAEAAFLNSTLGGSIANIGASAGDVAAGDLSFPRFEQINTQRVEVRGDVVEGVQDLLDVGGDESADFEDTARDAVESAAQQRRLQDEPFRTTLANRRDARQRTLSDPFDGLANRRDARQRSLDDQGSDLSTAIDQTTEVVTDINVDLSSVTDEVEQRIDDAKEEVRRELQRELDERERQIRRDVSGN
jgi:hypothetical protein